MRVLSRSCRIFPFESTGSASDSKLTSLAKSRFSLFAVELWCPWSGLNARPLPYQGSALPLSYMGAFNPVPGAGEGNRTLVVSLEGFCSTIELHPPKRWWRGKDSNLRRQSRQIYSLFPLTAREPLPQFSTAETRDYSSRRVPRSMWAIQSESDLRRLVAAFFQWVTRHDTTRKRRRRRIPMILASPLGQDIRVSRPDSRPCRVRAPKSLSATARRCRRHRVA